MQPAGSVPATTAAGHSVWRAQTSRAAAEVVSLGWLPVIALANGIGLLVAALADVGGRHNLWWAQVFFWTGLLAIFVPAAIRLAAAEASRQERIGIVLLVGMAFYAVKLMHSPTGFTFSDEFQHWVSVNNILSSGALFQRNFLLPVATYYPGLHIITGALAGLTGLPVFEAGILALAVGRFLFVASLFLFYERAGNSARVGGLATLIYTANPSFLFFDAQFAYESLALPLVGVALFAMSYRSAIPGRMRAGLNLIIILSLSAVVITHHMTSYMLLLFLVLWALVSFAMRRRSPDPADPRSEMLIMIVLAFSWFLYMATLVMNYLSPLISGAVEQLLRLIAGEASSRQLFQNFDGRASASAAEQLLAFTSVGFTLLAMFAGLLRVWRDHARANVLALALAVAALAYPVTLATRLTHRGLEIANRSSAFVFLPVSFTLAYAVAYVWLRDSRQLRRVLLFAVLASAILVGSVIVGFPRWARVPGPYLVIADSRSIEPQGLDAATWTRAYLGTNNRMVADRVNRLLLATYGGQRPVMLFGDGIQTPTLMLSPAFGADEQQILRLGNIRYVLTDARMTTAAPLLGFYYEKGDPRVADETALRLALEKFDAIAYVSRIFDSGDIAIYDVGRLNDAG